MAYQELTDEQVAFTDDLWGIREPLRGLEVKEATVSDWLRATVGAHMPVPHVMGELVATLKAAPEENWSLA